MVPAQAWRGPHRAGPLGASWEKAGLQDRSEGVIGPPSRPWRDERVDRAGIVQTGLTGSAEARAGLPRSYWSCPSEGQSDPGLKQHPRLRPFGITTRRSGRRSRNAKQTHGLRAPPGRSAPPRPNACERGRAKSRAQSQGTSPCGGGGRRPVGGRFQLAVRWPASLTPPPPTDRYAIASPTEGGSWLWG